MTAFPGRAAGVVGRRRPRGVVAVALVAVLTVVGLLAADRPAAASKFVPFAPHLRGKGLEYQRVSLLMGRVLDLPPFHRQENGRKPFGPPSLPMSAPSVATGR